MVSFSKEPNYSALKKIEAHDGNPKWAYIVICDDCSHKCSWCFGGFNDELQNRMSIESYKTILEKCKRIGIKQITIAGGEPTEHPNFLKFVKLTNDMGFLIHIASHGEHITEELAAELKRLNVSQVQVNFQGEKHHDKVHGVSGSYLKQAEGIQYLTNVNVEVTTTTTVGKYNLAEVSTIFKEAVSLGVDRLRVWESTGLGNSFRKGLEAEQIFKHCEDEANKLGYKYSLSYDPAYQDSDVNVPCLQLSNLFMYINSNGINTNCGAVPSSEMLSNFLKDDTQTILNNYLEFNKTKIKNGGMHCMARDDTITVNFA